MAWLDAPPRGKDARSGAPERRFIDLSIPLDNDVVTDPPFMRPKIGYQTHRQTLPEAQRFFPDVNGRERAAAINEIRPVGAWTRAIAIIEETGRD